MCVYSTIYSDIVNNKDRFTGRLEPLIFADGVRQNSDDGD